MITVIALGVVGYIAVGVAVGVYIHKREAGADEGQSFLIGAGWPVMLPIYYASAYIERRRERK
jgi:hypothetical protein